MGYTHYFKTVRVGKAEINESNYQKALVQCSEAVKLYNADVKAIDEKHEARLSGYTAHTYIGQYGGLEVNGTGDLSHESFCMREHFNQNFDLNFCKTNEKPYDTVVVACLCILKHHLGSAFSVESDGESFEWIRGVELAKSVNKSVEIPSTIVTKMGVVS